MKQYSKEFKEEAVRLSDEIGVKNAAQQLGIAYYTLADWRSIRRNKPPAKTLRAEPSERLICRSLRPCERRFPPFSYQSTDVLISPPANFVANAFAVWYDEPSKTGICGGEKRWITGVMSTHKEILIF